MLSAITYVILARLGLIFSISVVIANEEKAVSGI